jgi:hypothetical protein
MFGPVLAYFDAKSGKFRPEKLYPPVPTTAAGPHARPFWQRLPAATVFPRGLAIAQPGWVLLLRSAEPRPGARWPRGARKASEAAQIGRQIDRLPGCLANAGS